MKLLLANPRGFCAGVVRAINTVEKALDKWGAPIYVKHEIVHNKHVVNRLKDKGVIFVQELSEVPSNSRVIYSAHGVSPQVKEEAQRKGLITIDATCGLVTKVHSAAKLFASKGYHIILIGHKNHVEVMGTYGEAPSFTTIIEKVEDIEALPFSADDKLAYLTQTTLSLDDIKIITDKLKSKFPSITTLPTSSICYATTNRQKALMAITDKADVILVVGDPSSSNSNRLKETAKRRNVDAYLINNDDEIQKQWLDNKKVIGMTAGASTPEDVVQSCVARLKELGVGHVEEVVYQKEEVVFKLPQELFHNI
jgi:4-hydroxy-3-methylbut-2-en-1-yl diphosphate reductase